MRRSAMVSLAATVLGLGAAPAGFAQDSLGVTVAGSFPSGGGYGIMGCAVQGDLAFIAYRFGSLGVLDMADFDNIDEIGFVYAAGEPYSLIFHINTVFMAALQSGIKTFDVSDPENPQHLTLFDTGGYARSIAAAGEYAFVANGDFIALDISDPARPVILARLNLGQFCNGVEVIGDYAFVTCSEMFGVIDISNPRQPQRVASRQIPSNGWRMAATDTRAYVVQMMQGPNVNVRIFDISEPEEPEQIGMIEGLREGVYAVEADGDFLAVGSNYLRIYNVADPEDPVQVGWYASGVIRELVFDNPLVYAAQYGGFFIYDATNALGQPDLVLREDDLAHDFGQVAVGMTANWRLPMVNAGHLLLTISEMAVDDDAFALRIPLSRWQRQSGFQAGLRVQDTRLGGVEVVDGQYYITGGNDGAMNNFVYVFDDDGRVVRRFDQFAQSPWGMRDLAWDGELLWGADGNIVYGFTTQGELQEQFEAPLEVVRSVAYEPERELLWLADLNSPLAAVDREGNFVEELPFPGARNYGMAWYPEDADGFNLYIATWSPQRQRSLHKVNVADGEAMLAREDIPSRYGVRSAGIAISNELIQPGWDLVTLMEEDVLEDVEVWQLSDYYRGGELRMEAQDESQLTVGFTPLEERGYQAQVTIRSDDPDEPEIEIDLVGVGGENLAPEWIEAPESVTVPAGRLMEFTLQGRDPEGAPLEVRTAHGDRLPYRARLIDRGDGTAQFRWPTQMGDIGVYRAVFTLTDGASEVEREVLLTVEQPQLVDSSELVPAVFALGQPHPNPFNDRFSVEVSLPLAGLVTWRLMDLSGRVVLEMSSEFAVGVHRIAVQPSGAAVGVYLFELNSRFGGEVRKVVFLK